MHTLSELIRMVARTASEDYDTQRTENQIVRAGPVSRKGHIEATGDRSQEFAILEF
jgi:hypothetical protein